MLMLHNFPQIMQYSRLSTNPRRKDSPGFTIVELLIVIVVIAILAAVSIVAYRGIQDRARETSMISDAVQLQKSIQLNAVNNGNSISISKPIGYLKTTGIQKLTTPLQNAQSLTMYGVFDTNNNPSGTNWSAFVQLNPNASNNSLQLRTGATADTSARGFYANSAVQNRDLTSANILNTTRRHVGWIAALPNYIYSNYNSPAGAVSSSLASHAGWSFDSLRATSFNGVTFVTAIVFDEYHDAETRAEVIAWLNKEHNIGL